MFTPVDDLGFDVNDGLAVPDAPPTAGVDVLPGQYGDLPPSPDGSHRPGVD